MLEIQLAEVAHVPIITDLDESLTGHRHREEKIYEAIKNNSCLIALYEQELVGFLLLTNSFFGHSFVSLLIVDHNFRDQGIGKLLMHSAELLVKGDKVFTSTNTSNSVMQRLCKSLGYQLSGWIDHLDENDPELIYVKFLHKK